MATLLLGAAFKLLLSAGDQRYGRVRLCLCHSVSVFSKDKNEDLQVDAYDSGPLSVSREEQGRLTASILIAAEPC